MSKKRAIVRVKDVMSDHVDVVDGMLTVAEAMRAMKHINTRTLIVDKRDENDEYGLVLFRDLATKILSPGRSPDRVNVYEIMSKPVIHVDPEMDVRYCIRLLDRYGLSRVPVLDQGAIVGLISYTDIVLNGMGIEKSDT